MTKQEVVLAITHKDELSAVVWTDKNRREVFYKVSEMNKEDIERLLNNKE